MAKVMVQVTGRNRLERDDVTEVICEGTYQKKKGVHYIFYEVLSEGSPEENVKHKIQIHPDHVKISYSGGRNQSFLLVPGEDFPCLYETPFGQLSLLFRARTQEVKQEDGRLRLHLQYDIHSDSGLMSENDLEVLVYGIDIDATEPEWR